MTTETTNTVTETVESTGNQIIEIIEYLSEKLGIAIDWTAENVWPRIEDIFVRVTQYKIAVNTIWLIIGFILLIVAIVCVNKLWKDYKTYMSSEGNTFYWRYSQGCNLPTGGGVMAIVTAVLTFLPSIPIILVSAGSLLEWIFIPEIRLIDYVSSLINTL